MAEGRRRVVAAARLASALQAQSAPDRSGFGTVGFVMVTTFCVSLGAAFLVSYALSRRQRSTPARLTLRPLAIGVGGVIAVVCAIAALDLVSWDSAAAGGGCGIGIITGQWLAARRGQSPG